MLCHGCTVVVVQVAGTLDAAREAAAESMGVLGVGCTRVMWTDWVAWMRERIEERGGQHEMLTICEWEECREIAQGNRWQKVWAPVTMFVRKERVCHVCKCAEVDDAMGLRTKCIDCHMDGGRVFSSRPGFVVI